MKWFAGVRLLVLLRRIARALEQGNELTRERMKYDYHEWKDRPKPRHVEISQPTVRQWNNAYRKERDQ